MSKLRFATIMLPGLSGMGEKQDNGANIFDRFWPPSTPSGGPFDLGNVDTTMPALLHFITRSVHKPLNFITWNAPEDISSMSFEEAEEASRANKASGAEGFLVGDILVDSLAERRLLHAESDEIAGHNWMQQSFSIKPGIVRPTTRNTLGIHSRNNGSLFGNRDDFGIGNIYIMYYIED